jgi:hypothetical protein
MCRQKSRIALQGQWDGVCMAAPRPRLAKAAGWNCSDGEAIASVRIPLLN